MKMPKPAFIVNVERSAVANLPSAYVCTIWKIGTHSNEYKNKFHKEPQMSESNDFTEQWNPEDEG